LPSSANLETPVDPPAERVQHHHSPLKPPHVSNTRRVLLQEAQTGPWPAGGARDGRTSLASGMAARCGGRPAARGFSAAASPAPHGATPKPFLLRIHVGQRPASTSIGIGTLTVGPRRRREASCQALASTENPAVERICLERGPARGYESRGAVRAALGCRNPWLAVGAGRYGTALLDLWSGSLWRIQQVLRTKGHRTV
jgi:hypothetical protein